MHYAPYFVIPRGLSTLYRCSLTTVAQDKPYHEKPFIRDCFNHKGSCTLFRPYLTNRSRDQLLEFRTSSYETISSEFLVQGNFKHTQFSREHWNWRDSNTQPLAPKASAVSIELTWLLWKVWFSGNTTIHWTDNLRFSDHNWGRHSKHEKWNLFVIKLIKYWWFLS